MVESSKRQKVSLSTELATSTGQDRPDHRHAKLQARKRKTGCLDQSLSIADETPNKKAFQKKMSLVLKENVGLFIQRNPAYKAHFLPALI